MRIHPLLLTVAFAGVWTLAYVGTSYLLFDKGYAAFGHYFEAPLYLLFLVLLCPLLFAGHLLFIDLYAHPGWEYAFTAANALLWGWGASWLLRWVRRRAVPPGDLTTRSSEPPLRSDR